MRKKKISKVINLCVCEMHTLQRARKNEIEEYRNSRAIMCDIKY